MKLLNTYCVSVSLHGGSLSAIFFNECNKLCTAWNVAVRHASRVTNTTHRYLCPLPHNILLSPLRLPSTTDLSRKDHKVPCLNENMSEYKIQSLPELDSVEFNNSTEEEPSLHDGAKVTKDSQEATKNTF